LQTTRSTLFSGGFALPGEFEQSVAGKGAVFRHGHSPVARRQCMVMGDDLGPRPSNRIVQERWLWALLGEGCLHYSILTDVEMVREFLGPKQHLFCRFDYPDNRCRNALAAVPISFGGVNVQSPDDPLIREDFQRQLFIQCAAEHPRKSTRRSLKLS